MTTLYILIGMPGAGKTTWARQKRANDGGLCHADTNAIRANLTGVVAEQNRNHAVFAVFYRMLERALADGRDAIADSTGLTFDVRQRLLNLAHTYDAETHVILFTDPERAQRQNLLRDDVVPEHVMFRMEDRLRHVMSVINDEGYDAITRDP